MRENKLSRVVSFNAIYYKQGHFFSASFSKMFPNILTKEGCLLNSPFYSWMLAFSFFSTLNSCEYDGHPKEKLQ